jgi:predicted Kef-type K+ transport protein
MLALWLLGAFGFGLLARQLGLPPLIGFLVAGFLLHGFGFQAPPGLEAIAEIGVWLLLFSVGLKLRWQALVEPAVWATALLHLVLAGGTAALVVQTGMGLDWPVAALVGAAFGFSSTVLAAIVLEPKKELRAFHGRIAIGILVVQDVVAVIVLASGAGAAPPAYAALLVLLPLAKPLLDRLLRIAGHAELLVLLGVLLAVAVGGFGFRQLGLSPALGTLLLGAMMANHPRAVELSDALWGMKETFLVAFFLSIGLAGLPDPGALGWAGVLILVLPLKAALFFCLLLVFGLRARSGFLAALSLASYSEFGLIVTQLAVDEGFLDARWLTLAAIAVAVSFAIAAPMNAIAHQLYNRFERGLTRLERSRRHPDDEPVSVGIAEVVIFGMGRVGSGAYAYLKESGLAVVGMDSDLMKVQKHIESGHRVLYADAEDPELWHRLRLERVRAVMLALPELEAKIIASRELRRRGYQGIIAATHVFDEERAAILAAGADVTYNYFTEAGTGFAAHTLGALRAAPEGENQPV